MIRRRGNLSCTIRRSRHGARGPYFGIPGNCVEVKGLCHIAGRIGCNDALLTTVEMSTGKYRVPGIPSAPSLPLTSADYQSLFMGVVNSSGIKSIVLHRRLANQ